MPSHLRAVLYHSPVPVDLALFFLSLLSHRARHRAPSLYLFLRTAHDFRKTTNFYYYINYISVARVFFFTWALPPHTPKYPLSQSFQAYQKCQAVPDTSMVQLDNPPTLPTTQLGSPNLPQIRGGSRPLWTHKTTPVEGCPLQ